MTTPALYMGFLGAGDTIRIDIDAARAGQIGITFVRSEVGLAGTLSGTYVKAADGGYSVSGITLNSAVPAVFTNRLKNATITYQLLKGSPGAMLVGEISLPAEGATVAANYLFQTTVPATIDVAKLAGNYSFIGSRIDTDASAITRASPATGQIAFEANGTLRACVGGRSLTACTDADGNDITALGSLIVAPSQETNPGELDWVDAGKNVVGRLFVTAMDGQYRAMFQHQADVVADTPALFGYVFPAVLQPVGAFNGNYGCSEYVPDLGVQNGTIAVRNASLTLALQRVAGAEFVTMDNIGLSPDFDFVPFVLAGVLGGTRVTTLGDVTGIVMLADLGASYRFASFSYLSPDGTFPGGFGICASTP